jgi:hypothetical protein
MTGGMFCFIAPDLSEGMEDNSAVEICAYAMLVHLAEFDARWKNLIER